MRTHTQRELYVCVSLYVCVFVYVLLGKIHNDSRKNELQIYVYISLSLSPLIECRILASWPGQKLSSFALKWSSTAKHSQANAQRGETQREQSRASPHTAVRPYITKAMCVAAVACQLGCLTVLELT